MPVVIQAHVIDDGFTVQWQTKLALNDYRPGNQYETHHYRNDYLLPECNAKWSMNT